MAHKIRALSFVVIVLTVARPGLAQQARPAEVAVDSVIAYDAAVDQAGNTVPGVMIDTVVSAGLGKGFEAIVRPWVQRLGSTREWNRQVWLATLRYERGGRVALRVDGGLIAPPVGLANMMLRSPLNPTIAMPSSLFQPLPAIEPRGTRSTLLGAIYPYGVSATASMTHWDARVAVLDSSPLRARRIFAQTNPPQFTNVVLGGGVTPFIGFRVGASVTKGGWRYGSEVPASEISRAAAHAQAEADEYGYVNEFQPPVSGRSLPATVVTIETEFAVRYTKVTGEWVKDTIDTGTGFTSRPYGWFFQGQQTLSPRWFTAGRIERMAAPAMTTPGNYVTQHFSGVEEVIGYRLTPEITLRAGHRAREAFGRTTYAHTATFSVVWWKRWK